MSKKNIKGLYRLLVVAHPDDETLFFSGAVLQQRDLPWAVVCVTDGNADGFKSARAVQFQRACKKLKIKFIIQWQFPDIYEKRLDTAALVEQLLRLPTPVEIYTHGIVGEYGHPHHQDVSYSVHTAFAEGKLKKIPIWVPAYNCFAEKVFRLNSLQYAIKSKIYARVYSDETLRFSEIIPNRSVDEFTRLSKAEVGAIYTSLTLKTKLETAQLKKYKWFIQFLNHKIKAKNLRPF